VGAVQSCFVFDRLAMCCRILAWALALALALELDRV
jgi:hypothetical protein